LKEGISIKKQNKGKNFENEFKQSCQEQNIFVHRIKDSQISFKTEYNVSENPYDFIAFTNSTLYLIECKCTNLSFLTIARDKKEKKMIKKHQIDSLWEDSRYDNVFGAFLIDFKTSNNTYLLSIDDFMEWYDSNDKKSISEKDILTLEPIAVQKELKRTKHRYNIQTAFEQLKQKQ
jgi:penicillin-binding protein-related factor A (putative recombinase)